MTNLIWQCDVLKVICQINLSIFIFQILFKIALLKYVQYINKHKKTLSNNVFKFHTNVSVLFSGELKEVNSRVRQVIQSKSLFASYIAFKAIFELQQVNPWTKSYIGTVCSQEWTRIHVLQNCLLRFWKSKFLSQQLARSLKNKYLVKLNEMYNQRQALLMSANNFESNNQMIKE